MAAPVPTYPVTFMGQATGLRASGRKAAASLVVIWISKGHGPTIPPEYLPVMPPNARAPAASRLYRNSTFDGQAVNVGLGLPDRRQGSRKR